MTSTESISTIQDLMKLFCPERGEQDSSLDFVRTPKRWTLFRERAIFAGDGWIFAWVMDPTGKKVCGFEEWVSPGGLPGYVTLPDKGRKWRDGKGICPRNATAGHKRELMVTGWPALMRARDLRRLECLDAVSVWGLEPRKDDGAFQIAWETLAWRGMWRKFELRGILRCTA